MSDDLLTVQTVDTQQTLADLRALSKDLQTKALRSALRAGAKPIAQAMKTYAPDDPRTGGSRLEQAINITQAKTGTRISTGAGRRYVKLAEGEVGVIVGPNKKVGGRSMGALGLMLELGTKPHVISNKDSVLVIAGRYVAREVYHPGTRPRHWMRKAYTASRGQFESAFYKGLDRTVQKYGR